MRFTQADGDVLQSEVAYPLTQTPQIFRPNIFRDNAAAGADDRGEPYDVVAATGADVRYGHAGFDAKQTYELACFAGGFALFFVVPDRADDVSDRTIRFRKSSSRRAGLRREILGRAWLLISRIRWRKQRQAPYNIASSSTAAAPLAANVPI